MKIWYFGKYKKLANFKHDYINLDKRFDDIEISIADTKIKKDLKLSFKTNFKLNLISLEKWHQRFSPKVKISSIKKKKNNRYI